MFFSSFKPNVLLCNQVSMALPSKPFNTHLLFISHLLAGLGFSIGFRVEGLCLGFCGTF